MQVAKKKSSCVFSKPSFTDTRSVIYRSMEADLLAGTKTLRVFVQSEAMTTGPVRQGNEPLGGQEGTHGAGYRRDGDPSGSVVQRPRFAAVPRSWHTLSHPPTYWEGMNSMIDEDKNELSFQKYGRPFVGQDAICCLMLVLLCRLHSGLATDRMFPDTWNKQ